MNFFMFSDIDECANGNGGCSQLCINEVPGFSCDCNQGFELDDDQTNCKCMYTSSVLWFWLISRIELKISQHYFHVMITVVIMRSYVVMSQALRSVPAELVMNWQKMRRHALVQNL